MKNRLQIHDNWKTPDEYYNKWNKRCNFDFDPFPYNHDMSWDGLEVEWGLRSYVNPPYNQKMKEAAVEKAIEESIKGKLCFLLLPVSTSTVLFHDVIKPNASDIEFLKGRIPFMGINSKGQKVNYPNPKDTMISVYAGEDENGTINYVQLPEYIKNSGQFDSMTVIFDGRDVLKRFYFAK